MEGSSSISLVNLTRKQRIWMRHLNKKELGIVILGMFITNKLDYPIYVHLLGEELIMKKT